MFAHPSINVHFLFLIFTCIVVNNFYRLITSYAACQLSWAVYFTVLRVTVLKSNTAYFNITCHSVIIKRHDWMYSSVAQAETMLLTKRCSVIISPEGLPCYYDVMIADEITSRLIWFFVFAESQCLVFPDTTGLMCNRSRTSWWQVSIPSRTRSLRIDVHTMLKPTLLTSKYSFPLHFFWLKGVWEIIPFNIFILEEVCARPHAFIKADFSEVVAFKTETWILIFELNNFLQNKEHHQICSACQHRSQLSELQMALGLCTADDCLWDSPFISREGVWCHHWWLMTTMWSVMAFVRYHLHL